MREHLNREDGLVNEMKHAFDEQISHLNPVEDMLTSFMTYTSEIEPFEMPLSSTTKSHDILIDFHKFFKNLNKPNKHSDFKKQRVYEMLESMRSKSHMSTEDLPVTFVDIKLSTQNDNHKPVLPIKPEFETHDYFEPIVATEGRHLANKKSK